MQNQEESVQVSEPTKVEPSEIVYQQDKAVIDMQIATAKAYPRVIQRATENAIAIVSLDKEIATTCTYALPRGGKSITGPSVHLARILAQTWGNLRIETKVIDISHKHITSQAIAFDLESNVAIKVEVKRSIVGKYRRYTDDMITVTGNAANAIALRNAIFAVIPRGILNKVWATAKQKVVGDLSSEAKLIASRKKIFDEFKASYKVDEVELLELIGKPSIDNVTGDDLVTILGVRQAIVDGDTTIALTFKKSAKKVDKNGKTKEENVTDAVNKGMSKGKATEAKK